MGAPEVLHRLETLGITLEMAGDKLRFWPASRVPPDLVEELRKHKAAVLARLRHRTQLLGLPWPVGYGGLPADEVGRAEAHNDRLGVHDPVARRLNVLSWMRCHFRDRGDVEMAEQMRNAYHELRHADPRVQALCGLCEYRGEDGYR